MSNTSQPQGGSREKRGLALFLAGAVTRRGSAFTVAGLARNYTVSLDASGEPRCDCPDYRKRRETCKHGFAAVAFAAVESCRRKRTAVPKTGTRHGRTARPHNPWGLSGKQVAANLDRMEAR